MPALLPLSPPGAGAAADYTWLDLRGAHYALGQAQARQTERFVIPPWWPAPPPLAFALDCARQIAEVHAPLLDELRGYADGQGLVYADVLRGVCRQTMRLRARPPYPEGGCSSLAVVAPDGRVRVGRNYDFHPVQRVRQRLRLTPEQGRPSVGTRGSVPGGRYDGVNDAGLFICLHVALSDEPASPQPGIPFHLLPRLVLETCARTRDAVDLLTHVRHLHAFNYLIADVSGDLAVVEAHPQQVRVAAQGEGFAACTNHFRHPDMRALQHGRRLAHSEQRLAFLYSQREALRAGAEVLTALCDHPSGLCGHAGGHTTLWSLTADLTKRTLAYTRGAPCTEAFEAMPWPSAN
jgi:hypothetical protein